MQNFSNIRPKWLSPKVLQMLAVGVCAAAFQSWIHHTYTRPGAEQILESLTGSEAVTERMVLMSTSSALANAGLDGKVLHLEKGPMPHMYAAITDRGLFWVSDDFRYVFTGTAVDTTAKLDVGAFLSSMWERSTVLARGGVATISNVRAATELSQPDGIAKPSQRPIEPPVEPPRDEKPADAEFEMIQQQLAQGSAASPVGELEGAAAPGDASAGGVDLVRIGYKPDGTAMTTEERRSQVAKVSATVPDAFTIKYPAANEKATITAFVDYTCSACKRLHAAIPELNARGISVRMMFYPRAKAAGQDRMAAVVMTNMANAWCAPDPRVALDKLYSEGEVDAADCGKLPKGMQRMNPPIEEQFALGELFGIDGTPYIFMGNGNTLPGFSSVDEISELALQK